MLLVSIDLIFLVANRCLGRVSSVPFLVQFQFHSEQSETTPTHPQSSLSVCLLVAHFIDYHESCAYHVTFSPHDSRQQQRRWQQRITAPLGSFCNAARNPTCPDDVRAHKYSCMVILEAGCSISVIFGRGLTSGWSHQRLSSSRRLFPDTPCGKVCIASPQSSCSMCRYLETIYRSQTLSP